MNPFTEVQTELLSKRRRQEESHVMAALAKECEEYDTHSQEHSQEQ